jgi:hypothetical protein
MRAVNHVRFLLALAGLSIAMGPSAAGGLVAIMITNDNTNDVLVTLYDMNTHPHSKLLDGQRINGFAAVPISVAADASGTGHVSWHATTADKDDRRCGHKDKPGLADQASVHVYAHSSCTSGARH